MAGEATLARPARDAVHHRHTRTVLQLTRDLVTEHGAALGPTELLNVGAAKTAGSHANEQAGA